MKQDKKEHEIKTLSDFKISEYLGRDYERYFECPKCGSSLIILNDEYSKNNIANSIEDSVIQNSEKLVLSCSACNHTDILLKFLKPKNPYEHNENLNKIRLFNPSNKFSTYPLSAGKII